MGTLMKASLFVLAVLAAASTHAAEPTGEAMAATCAACHGTHGKLGIVEYMPLAGLSEKEFVRAMQDFRSGKRLSTLMGHVANGFSDNEILAMAKYFANVK